ncbi:MAG: hypothetical protein CSB55_06565 [Candidatus Cloacimonadota bacterium]|nr:MAG: hypothetical protein CSB55_06565 [Candidatus Cloacimonadota bacterium]
MKKTAFLFLLILISTILNSNPIPLEQALQTAKNVLSESDQILNISRSSDHTPELSSLSNNQIYIFNGENKKGYVIISNSDAAFPVLAFSSSQSFSGETIPPALRQFLDFYSAQIEEIETNKLEKTAEISSAWEKYSQADFVPERNRDVAEPLVKSLWNQCKYYNAMCPEDPGGVDGHVPVGCVATAMSQIMHYHKYPIQGTGSHGYYSNYGYQEANFAAATYNWDNIPNYLTDYNDDLAQLGYHCGVSVDMNYGTDGSGSYTENVVYALNQYFDYNNDIAICYKEDYSEEEWKNILKENLDQNLPMEYSGSGEYGHAFICDGYQGNDHFHFNWGWDGLFNGFYYLDNLNPRTSTFNNWQAAVINIYPNHLPEVNFEASYTNVNIGSPVDFTDLTLYTPYDWTWNFPGAETTESNLKNPTGIVYSEPGDYDVILSATNRLGTNSLTLENYIHVADNFAPLASFTLQDSIIKSDQSIILYDNSLNSPTSIEWKFSVNGNEFEPEYLNGTDQHSQNPEISFPVAQPYHISLSATNDSGTDETEKRAIYAGGLPLPFIEDFEIPLQLDAWETESEDDYISWDGVYFVDGNGPGAKSIGLNFYAYEDIGEKDRLISPLLNFTNKTDITLSFMHAYANRIPAKNDELEILISSDAGVTWESIAVLSDNSDENFATHAPTNNRFFPASENDWADVYSFSLDNYQNMPDIKICFQTLNDNGNCLYLDKIRITASDITEKEPSEYNPNNISVNSYPNPFILSRHQGSTISYSLPKATPVEISVYNIKGQKVKQLANENNRSGNHQIYWNGKDDNNQPLSSGIYFYKLKTPKTTSANKMLIIK